MQNCHAYELKRDVHNSYVLGSQSSFVTLECTTLKFTKHFFWYPIYRIYLGSEKFKVEIIGVFFFRWNLNKANCIWVRENIRVCEWSESTDILYFLLAVHSPLTGVRNLRVCTQLFFLLYSLIMFSNFMNIDSKRWSIVCVFESLNRLRIWKIRL